METLSRTAVELPRILERQGRPYRYLFGITQLDSRFYDGLARLDTWNDTSRFWKAEGCFAGEPVPRQAPDGGETVLLSVVLDTKRGQSFLLVLNAESMEELARAYVPAVVPFGFHGGFTGD